MMSSKFPVLNNQTADLIYLNQIKSRIIQYMVDVVEDLSCPVQDLVEKCKIFNNKNEAFYYINYTDDGDNFCILASNDNSAERIHFIPISRCPYDKLDTKCTDSKCVKFHIENICYYFLYKHCQFNKKCNSGEHTFNRRNNVFSARKLTNENSYSDQTLMKLIRLCEKSSIKICNFLNENKTLACKGDCDSLHCCKFQMTGKTCLKPAEKCAHGHTLYDSEHNRRVLSSKKLLNVNELDLRNFIHDAYYGKKIKFKISFLSVETLSLKSEPSTSNTTLSNSNLNKISKNVVVYDSNKDNSKGSIRKDYCDVCHLKDAKKGRTSMPCGCTYCFTCLFTHGRSQNNVCLNKKCKKLEIH